MGKGQGEGVERERGTYLRVVLVCTCDVRNDAHELAFLAPGGTCIPQQDAFSSCVRLKPRRCDHHLFRVLKPPSLLDVLKQNGHDRPSRSSDQLWSARIIKKVRPFCTRSTPKALMHLRRASCVKYLIFQMDLWNVRRMGRVVYRP